MRGEVGGDDSWQLVFIAVGDEVDDGTEHITVFDDFVRLGTKVIYCQDVLVHERPPIFGMRFADVGKVFGIVEADAEVLTCRLILDTQMIDEVLHGIDKGRFAIATTASKQEAVLARHATKPVGNTCNLFGLIKDSGQLISR